MKKKDIAVIIPCYNSGDYLKEAIESIYASEGEFSYEIIVVNDGSTDKKTIDLLQHLGAENIKIYHQENKGPASARNSGIRQSDSNYILFLDSDNKIKPQFVPKCLALLNRDATIDIVYGMPEFFGDPSGINEFVAGKFDLDKMWHHNYIDMCSVVRSSLFESIGLLDESPILIGHEDWELWIRAGIANKKFYFINQPVFDYRLSSNSLLSTEAVKNKYEKMFSYVYGKNYSYFLRRMELDRHDRAKPFRTFIKHLYHKYFKKGS